MNSTALAGWTPIHLATSGKNSGTVDWCRLGGLRFTAPFFEQTVSSALRDPARLLFRRQTPLTALEALSDDSAALAPRGFIFHCSRCGSTLAAQTLAALPQNRVLSEAPPIDQLLNLQRRDPSLSRAQRIAQLRGLIHALGRPGAREERQLFIKFDSWHLLELPLIMEAFPDAPGIFLYRDPVEVMVSQRRQRGLQMIPGVLDPRIFGLEADAVTEMSPDEYCARVLARIFVTAAMHAPWGRSRFVNFSELPDALGESLGDFFGIAWTENDCAQMRRAALADAKTPELSYADDRAGKQRDASASIRELAIRWLDQPYGNLEALRLAQRDGGGTDAAFTASASSSSRSQSFTTQSITR